ncbi:MAG: hypothetical protein ALAOOOJD_02223 [bacterium]|nr:hypothetical protein [bacterium]
MPKHKCYSQAGLAQQDKREEFCSGNQTAGKNVEHENDSKIGYIKTQQATCTLFHNTIFDYSKFHYFCRFCK